MTKDIQPFLSQVTAWAQSQAAILAVALVGSYARSAARPDSDVDLAILTVNPSIFLDDTAWTQQFGAVARQQTEFYGKVTSLRVWYQDGREVEFGLTGRSWAAEPLDPGTRRVITDGMRVIFEREALLRKWENDAFKNQP